MGKKKKSLVEKVKDVFTKEEVTEEVSVASEEVSDIDPMDRSIDFGVPSEDEVLVELEEGE